MDRVRGRACPFRPGRGGPRPDICRSPWKERPQLLNGRSLKIRLGPRVGLYSLRIGATCGVTPQGISGRALKWALPGLGSAPGLLGITGERIQHQLRCARVVLVEIE